MKKILVLIMAMAISLSMTACGSDKEAISSAPTPPSQPSVEAPEEAPEGDAVVITLPVEISNETGVDIYGLYISPSSSDQWSDDLAPEIIYNDSTVTSSLTMDASTLLWDLSIEDEEGTTLDFFDLNFSECDVSGGFIRLYATDDGYLAEVK